MKTRSRLILVYSSVVSDFGFRTKYIVILVYIFDIPQLYIATTRAGLGHISNIFVYAPFIYMYLCGLGLHIEYFVYVPFIYMCLVLVFMCLVLVFMCPP
jgi:hypothetical protein